MAPRESPPTDYLDELLIISSPEDHAEDDDDLNRQIDFNDDRIDESSGQRVVDYDELLQQLPEDIRWQGDQDSFSQFLELARLCDMRGDRHFENQEFNSAIVSYLHSTRLREAVLSTSNSTFTNDDANNTHDEIDLMCHTEYMANINTFGKVAAVFRDLGNLESADEMWSHILRLLRGVISSGIPYLDMGQVLSDIGFVHNERRELNEAASAYLESLRLQKSKYGEYSSEVAQILESTAAIYYRMNDIPRCLSFLFKALNCWRIMEGEELSFQRVLNDIEAVSSPDKEGDIST
mmetsp:Transcript_10805/g.23727  ORF Transcript_10805/g.23727 Transcript_10805/m.23727 type:complete len:293 (-) Transcript_10805:96-974(-)|eukprot:CAMPEP_0113299426 /NCGR_PEP_ID=MMETSP0010_2-20120614/1468_1 /TAXON_ID=216773 ORGANISM="Corethron hystrix, Strain 308" /NCGR_SAMPLE_ID=MMETSP0010_2 /ASSEMBLY_ACC=CAM_ASM_000155 /LENGTH=292 /DNA_ID=CAMNT_0000152663 /DNA_START=209 /DNA_END=1087 /DNA_ORIENTATION=- /assembly_acc=CAM_ASM_000155